MKNTENDDFLVLDAASPEGELTDLELNLILGGYEPGYQESDPNANGWDLTGSSSHQGPYGPPPPPGMEVAPSGPYGGGLPPGAPGMAQPGFHIDAEMAADAAAYGARHAIAEGFDIASAATPFPANYILDKVGDFIRPSESNFQEYDKNH